MKKLLVCLLFTPFFSSAQKIVERKIDEFTKHRITRTSWDVLAYNWHVYSHTRISHIDDSYFFNFKYVGNSTSGMLEGSDFMLKIADDSIITLHNIKYQPQCVGCGAIGINSAGRYGLNVTFELTASQLIMLAKNKVVKVRFYLSDGYVEESIGKKNADNLPVQASLIIKDSLKY